MRACYEYVRACARARVCVCVCESQSESELIVMSQKTTGV